MPDKGEREVPLLLQEPVKLLHVPGPGDVVHGLPVPLGQAVDPEPLGHEGMEAVGG